MPSFTPKIASRVTLDLRQLARVKLARVECSAEAGFPAEAASMLAAVLTGGGVPVTTADYAGRRFIPYAWIVSLKNRPVDLRHFPQQYFANMSTAGVLYRPRGESDSYPNNANACTNCVLGAVA